MRCAGRLASPKKFEDIVPATLDGKVLRLGELARCRTGRTFACILEFAFEMPIRVRLSIIYQTTGRLEMLRRLLSTTLKILEQSAKDFLREWTKSWMDGERFRSPYQ